MSPQEREALHAARKMISSREWKTFTSVLYGTLEIDAALIEKVLAATPEKSRDKTEAMKLIALLTLRSRERLQGMELGQSEIVNLLPPCPPRLYVLRIDIGRQTRSEHISENQFYPHT